MQQQASTRFHFLDSIRGIASLMVVIYHANGWLDFSKDAKFNSHLLTHILNSFINGNNAVSLFFVLSGFVLTFKYFSNEHERQNTHFNYANFIVKRFFRLNPVYIAIALVIFFFSGEIDLKTLVKSCTLFIFPDYAEKVIGPAWSLAIEAQMSLFIPFMVIIALKDIRLVVFFTIILMAFSSVGVYAFHFLCGLLLAYYYPFLQQEQWRKSSLYPYRYVLLVIFFLLTAGDQIFLMFDAPAKDSKSYIGNLAKAVGSSGFLFLVIANPLWQKKLEIKPLLFLGKVSYGLYLVHWFVCVDIVEKHYFDYLYAQIGSFYLSHVLVRYFLWCSASLCAATLLYYLVEKPAISLGRKINIPF
jgi:peptidoglycan/LPS O-acetylase OafA/YrhL